MSTQIKRESIDNIEFTIGSGNVFADLGLPDAEELLVKAQLLHKINMILKKKKLKQAAAAKILQTDQSKVSLITRGKLSVFSLERLVSYLNLLNQDVELIVKESKNKKHIGAFRVVQTMV